MDDFDLLDDYARTGSHAAFDALVKRHAGWLYASARRRLGSADLADDVTQAVFIVLARKANAIGRRASLAAWLHRVCRYAATDALRRRGARRRHERFAARREAVSPFDADAAFVPYLDQALDRLPTRDREAVVLRYYTGRTLEQIGDAQRVAASTVQRRIERALSRLGLELKRRGVAPGSAGAVAAVLTATGVAVAPPSAVAGVTALATASSAVPATTAGPIGLAKGTIKTMTLLKLKFATAAVAGALTLGVGGAAIEHAVAQARQAEAPGAVVAAPAAPAASTAISAPAATADDLSSHFKADWVSAAFDFRHDNPAAVEKDRQPVDAQTLTVSGQLKIVDVDRVLGFDRFSGTRVLFAQDQAGRDLTALARHEDVSQKWYAPLTYQQEFDNTANRFVERLRPAEFGVNFDVRPPVPTKLTTIKLTVPVLTYDHAEHVDVPFVPNGVWVSVMPGVRLRFKAAEVNGNMYRYELTREAADTQSGLPGQVNAQRPLPERMVMAKYLIDADGRSLADRMHPFGNFDSIGNEQSVGGLREGDKPPAAMRFDIAVGLSEQALPVTLRDVVLPGVP